MTIIMTIDTNLAEIRELEESLMSIFSENISSVN